MKHLLLHMIEYFKMLLLTEENTDPIYDLGTLYVFGLTLILIYYNQARIEEQMNKASKWAAHKARIKEQVIKKASKNGQCTEFIIELSVLQSITH